MASFLTGGMVQDQNLNVHFNGVSVGKPNVHKPQRNRGLSARKPLGDLSNAVTVTPSSTLVSKNQNSKAVKDTCGVSKKKSILSQDQEKAPKTGRKALSDISNSGKPEMHHVSKKKNQGIKLSALSEESTLDGGFLHNHHECVKAHTKAIDMDEFLQTIGLDNGLHNPSMSPLCIKSKFETPLRYLELDEMDESFEEDRSMLKTELLDNLHSPLACRTPKSASHFAAHLRDYNHFNFAFTATPKLSKH